MHCNDGNNLNEVIDSKIEQLKRIISSYKGTLEQKTTFQNNLFDLRQSYQQHKILFTKEKVNSINDLIQQFNKLKTLKFPKAPINSIKYEDTDFTNRDIPNWSVVVHKVQHYKGTIDGSTEIMELFENRKSTSEYRIRITKDDVRIAAKENLQVIGYSKDNKYQNAYYDSKCRGCGSSVDSSLKKCAKCNWYICEECGTCGCGYTKK